MKRYIWILGAVGATALAGCSSATDSTLPAVQAPPSFSVRTRVTTQPNSGGCYVYWDAIPSKTLVTVNYRVGTLKPASAPASMTSYAWSGTFTDSTRKSWDQRIDLTFGVHWEVSVGTWTDSATVAITNCPNTT